MNYRKVLISSALVAGIMLSANVAQAAGLQAQVSKNDAVSAEAKNAKYTNISTLIEYNQYADAEKKLKEILNKNPDDIDALALRALAYAKQYKLAPAQSEINRLMPSHRNHSNLHYAQGMVYMMRQASSDVDYINSTEQLIDGAIKEFVEAINIDSNNYPVYSALGVATLKKGNVDDARDLFKIAVKINPNYANGYDNLGLLEVHEQNLDEAEKYFKEALRANSHNPSAMYHLGIVESLRGNNSAALTWLNHSLHIHPNCAPALNLQGELYLRQGNQAAAINSFRKAEVVKPEYTPSYMNLSRVYEDRVDFEMAVEQLKTMLTIKDDNAAKMRIADMSLQLRKYQQALDYYTMLLGNETYNDDAVIGLANTYYEMAKDAGDNGNFTTNQELYLAYDYINKALEKCPNALQLHLAKIRLSRLVHRDPTDMSKQSLNYIIQSADNSVMGSVLKAEAYLALGREQDAVYTFENARDFSKSVRDDLYLAEIMVHNKQFRTARTTFQKVLSSEPTNTIALDGVAYIDLCELKSNEFFDIAKRQYKEANYASTIEYCNKAIDFYHNRSEIAKLKAMAYEAELNYQGATKYYMQYLSMEPNAADKDEITAKISKFKARI
ncbi:MAG: tetratricopeptide repeat protein [Fusobacterium sp.]|nr:tetratricopeptide repeat protein [Fusobacterium sp.]